MHLGMIGREPIRLRMAADVGNPEGAVLADDQAEQSAAAWQVADPPPLLVADAARDESLDGPLGIDDADRGVFGADQLAHSISDELQDSVDLEGAADAADRLVERAHHRWELEVAA